MIILVSIDPFNLKVLRFVTLLCDFTSSPVAGWGLVDTMPGTRLELVTRGFSILRSTN